MAPGMFLSQHAEWGGGGKASSVSDIGIRPSEQWAGETGGETGRKKKRDRKREKERDMRGERGDIGERC